jgi:hypothetical protein
MVEQRYRQQRKEPDMLDTLIQIGDTTRQDGIAVTALFPRLTPRAAYLTLDDALAGGLAGSLHISEVGAAGSVPELFVHNPLDTNVLLYDGEELVGAKQNRILNVTVLVGAQSELRIPVSCVEAGRWRDDSAAFAAAGHTASPRVRARKAAMLHSKPLERGIAQSEVWNAVADEARLHGVHSPTGAQHDVFKARSVDLGTLRAAFALQPGQCGAILSIDGHPSCLDYVSRPDAFARLHGKLLDGYLLDALARTAPTGAPSEPEAFLTSLGAAAQRKEPSAGLGMDVRFSAPGVIASGLDLDTELLQLSAYAADDRFRRADGRIARPSRRL